MSEIQFQNAVCKRETEKALLVEIEGEEHWVPKSQIHEDSEVFERGGEGLLVVSKWWAKRQGLGE